jgi:EmrB/QacA subfamily drug resistance transporter
MSGTPWATWFPRFTPALIASLLGFFIVTFDAVVVNVALPTVQRDLGSSVAGLQWIVDGYTLMFAAFLLSSGVFSDRIGAHRAFSIGVVSFGVASLSCAVAASLPVLVIARFVQGGAAAVMMPSSTALLSQAYDDPRERARAISLWGIGGGLASSAAPVIGGLLTQISWRLIFLINVPVVLLTLLALRGTARSAGHPRSFDLWGQIAAVLAVGGLTFGAIEAGSGGIWRPPVVCALATALVAATAFAASQRYGHHPMVPRALAVNPTLRLTAVISFAFMVSFYGLPFLFTLYFQQQRGLSALATGSLFLPMMLTGALLSPFSARMVDRIGPRAAIVLGLGVMTTGCVSLAALSGTAPLPAPALLLMLIGLGGPLTMLPSMSLLLSSVDSGNAGTASGVLNTSRQVGGALAIAIFGALLANHAGFIAGLRLSLVIAAGVSAAAGLAGIRLNRSVTEPDTTSPIPAAPVG